MCLLRLAGPCFGQALSWPSIVLAKHCLGQALFWLNADGPHRSVWLSNFSGKLESNRVDNAFLVNNLLPLFCTHVVVADVDVRNRIRSTGFASTDGRLAEIASQFSGFQ
jgi:hypothetical protein